MNKEELLKYMSFTDDKVMFDKCFYQEVMMPCFSNSITYKNIVKELEKENQQLKQQLQQRDNIINDVIHYIRTELLCFDNESVEYIEGLKILKKLNIDKGE